MLQTRSQLETTLNRGRSGLAALVDELLPVIHARVARALLRRRQQAAGRDIRQEIEDLTQEVFLALFADDARTLRAWDPDKGLSFKNFAGLVADRQVLSILRTGRRNPWTEDPTSDEAMEAHLGGAAAAGTSAGTGSPDQEALLADREVLEQVLDRLMEQLSPLGRVVFEALFLEEQTIEQICERMDMRPDAVYAWRSRLIKRSKQIFAEVMSDSQARSRRPERKGAR